MTEAQLNQLANIKHTKTLSKYRQVYNDILSMEQREKFSRYFSLEARLFIYENSVDDYLSYERLYLNTAYNKAITKSLSDIELIQELYVTLPKKSRKVDFSQHFPEVAEGITVPRKRKATITLNVSAPKKRKRKDQEKKKSKRRRTVTPVKDTNIVVARCLQSATPDSVSTEISTSSVNSLGQPIPEPTRRASLTLFTCPSEQFKTRTLRLKELEQSNAELTAEIARNNQKYGLDIRDLETKIAEGSDRIAQLRLELEELTTANTKLEEQCETKSKKIEGINTDLAQQLLHLENQIHEQEAIHAKLTEQARQLDTQVAEIDSVNSLFSFPR